MWGCASAITLWLLLLALKLFWASLAYLPVPSTLAQSKVSTYVLPLPFPGISLFTTPICSDSVC
jgi:hypothetical protein